MSHFFWFTYAILWFLIVLLALLVLLLYRHFGLMLLPGAQRISLGGLDLDARAPSIVVRSRDGRDRSVEWVSERSDQTAGSFVVLALPGCPLCDHLRREEHLDDFPLMWPGVRFMWIDAAVEADAPIPDGWQGLLSEDRAAHEAMDIPGSPFGYGIRADGTIGYKGLVNIWNDLREALEKVFGEPRTEPEEIDAGRATSHLNLLEG
jgi:hypothetical protein